MITNPRGFEPPPAAQPQPPLLPEQPIELKQLVDTLRRHWFMIGFWATAAVGIVGYMAYTTPPRYRANAVVRLANARQQLTGGIDGTRSDNLLGQALDPLLSQIQILQSRMVAAEVVKSEPLGLQFRPVDFPGKFIDSVSISAAITTTDTITLAFSDAWVSASGHGGHSRVPYGQRLTLPGLTLLFSRKPDGLDEGRAVTNGAEGAVSMLVGNLTARPRKGTDIIDVEYVANDPAVAQRVVNAAVRSFQAYNTRASQQQSVRRREFIEEQVEQTDSMLASAQRALGAFRSTQNAYTSQQRIALEQTGVAQLDVRRSELDADRSTATELLSRLKQGQRDSSSRRMLQTLMASPAVSISPVVQQLHLQLIQYERSRDSMTIGRFGSAPSNPDVQRLNSLITTTEARVIDAVDSYVASVTARIAALDALRRRNTDALARIPVSETEEARLTERVETAKKLADQLRQEYQRARIAEAVEVGQVEIIDFAQRGSRIASRASLKLLTAAVLGFIAALAFAQIRDRLNNAIRTTEDAERSTKTAVLSVIPRVERFTAGQMLGRFVRDRNGRKSLKGKGAHGQVMGKELITISDTRSTGAEAYRTLRTNLIFSRASGTLRNLLVASASPSEGKTTTAANLAVAFAQQGVRTVVIDCDLRRARLHDVFDTPREPGLTDAVLDITKLDSVLRSTLVPGLTLLPAGVLPPNPSELLGSRGMRDLLNALSTKFELTIIDSPPVLAAADAAILGSYVDGAVMVVKAGKTPGAAAANAIQQLGAVGTRILGCVVNDPDAAIPKYGGYYYYYQYYGSGARA